MWTDATMIARTLPPRLALFALLWWVLTDGRVGSWTIGVPGVLLAALVSALSSARVGVGTDRWTSWSLRGVLRLVPFFLWYSLRGGTDVAFRAFAPTMPLAPDLVDYPLRLPPGRAQVLMANLTSLMPGTLSVLIQDRFLRVHVLNLHGAYESDLESLERHVAAVFRLQLAEQAPGSADAAP